MTAETGRSVGSTPWEIDPFEELYRLWKAITEGIQLGIPHVVGRARVEKGRVSGLEMNVILHETETELSFKDGDYVYFIIPAKPEEGIEGIYVRLNKILGEKG